MADFGLTEDMYNNTYFHQKKSKGSEEKVRIRWMAPESIENSVYTEVTDVVSFVVIEIGQGHHIIHLVVLWSDSVGDIHLWEGAICWSTCYGSPKYAKERRETGKT